MTRAPVADTESLVFRRGSAVYPRPVARACGRICRAENVWEYLDSVLKCAETVTRYACSLAISSFAARDDQSIAMPVQTKRLFGITGFGTFLRTVADIADVDCSHPLRHSLHSCLSSTGVIETRSAHADLEALVKVRNEIAHDLKAMSEAKALCIQEEERPQVHLRHALEALEPVLALPLFVIDDQELVHGQIVARRLLLMGESIAPLPDKIHLTAGLMDIDVPYLGVEHGALPLAPLLSWDLVLARADYAIYFLQDVSRSGNCATLTTVSDDEAKKTDDTCSQIVELMQGMASSHVEQSRLASGQDFVDEWRDRRRVLERVFDSHVPFEDFDASTLLWLAGRIAGARDEQAARQTVREHLLDGRDQVTEGEWRQLILLLGREDVVRLELGKSVIDCRVCTESDAAVQERVEHAGNVLGAMQTAVQFLDRHLLPLNAAGDDRTAQSGPSAFSAVRHMLTNLLMHQDYSDQRAPGQVTIIGDRITFFNAGRSLTSKTPGTAVGRSMTRNPLIARAFRLLGYAGLAGTGLAEAQRSMTSLGAMAPLITSDDEEDTFTLTLTLRPTVATEAAAATKSSVSAP